MERRRKTSRRKSTVRDGYAIYIRYRKKGKLRSRMVSRHHQMEGSDETREQLLSRWTTAFGSPKILVWPRTIYKPEEITGITVAFTKTDQDPLDFVWACRVTYEFIWSGRKNHGT
jgi:hypothetical protein